MEGLCEHVWRAVGIGVRVGRGVVGVAAKGRGMKLGASCSLVTKERSRHAWNST